MTPSTSFTCNVCGRRSAASRAELDRESATCDSCGSSVRYRAVVHLLSTALFGESLALPDFPRRPDVVGLGMSDWEPFADRLGSRLAYTNTFYDHEPRLDLTAAPDELLGSLDFLVCMEVLEHVPPPVERAARACHDLLKPGGLLIVTSPYLRDGEHAERFPGLAEYELIDFKGTRLLVYRTVDGLWKATDDLIFHGGGGETLELRQFSWESLERLLQGGGFVDISEMTDEVEELGIVWLKPWSLPIVARREAG